MDNDFKAFTILTVGLVLSPSSSVSLMNYDCSGQTTGICRSPLSCAEDFASFCPAENSRCCPDPVREFMSDELLRAKLSGCDNNKCLNYYNGWWLNPCVPPSRTMFYCAAQNVYCCTSACRITNECLGNGGYCISNPSKCDGVVSNSLCKGISCYCCMPPPTTTTSTTTPMPVTTTSTTPMETTSPTTTTTPFVTSSTTTPVTSTTTPFGTTITTTPVPTTMTSTIISTPFETTTTTTPVPTSVTTATTTPFGTTTTTTPFGTTTTTMPSVPTTTTTTTTPMPVSTTSTTPMETTTPSSTTTPFGTSTTTTPVTTTTTTPFGTTTTTTPFGTTTTTTPSVPTTTTTTTTPMPVSTTSTTPMETTTPSSTTTPFGTSTTTTPVTTTTTTPFGATVTTTPIPTTMTTTIVSTPFATTTTTTPVPTSLPTTTTTPFGTTTTTTPFGTTITTSKTTTTTTTTDITSKVPTTTTTTPIKTTTTSKPIPTTTTTAGSTCIGPAIPGTVCPATGEPGVACTCPKSCSDYGPNYTGITEICPNSICPPVKVKCRDGWTMYLCRNKTVDPPCNFKRDWPEYKRGFGSAHGEYWLGTEHLHELTRDNAHNMRMHGIHPDGSTRTLVYSYCRIGSESTNYLLNISGYDATSSTGYDLFVNPPAKNWILNGASFSTRDRDNDKLTTGSCSLNQNEGGWWFNDCTAIKPTQPNIDWYFWNYPTYTQGRLQYLYLEIKRL